MLETVKDNPIPSLIAGLSIGWLMSKGRSSGRQPGRSRAGYYDYNYETGFGESQYQEYGDGASHPSTGERVKQSAQQARETAQQYGQQAQQRAQEYGRQAQQRAQQTASEAQQGARRTADQVVRMVEHNPLGTGLATLAIGAFAGLMVPGTRREDELMGETRDRVVHRAEETARETADRARHVAEKTAEEAQKTAKEESRRQMEQSQASKNE